MGNGHDDPFETNTKRFTRQLRDETPSAVVKLIFGLITVGILGAIALQVQLAILSSTTVKKEDLIPIAENLTELKTSLKYIERELGEE